MITKAGGDGKLKDEVGRMKDEVNAVKHGPHPPAFILHHSVYAPTLLPPRRRALPATLKSAAL